ncbi:FtsH protease activity modulator HflK [Parasphaerochaeta coccoides]|uniref:Protein HflK n=1 Tax=Parasphaerochaeta coccoides (strain ATCC BAA-1237 / DSM 17374 / SPN1) TaxID=760011 RepID=F4GLG2_PARC1|nr:FtsH protease activity modulator HflK [Parasphaerochaeta coccoides]AEC01932.1 protease FtsH subunit HflK [Parasphaerochaeta coccoides DSM 17374]
MENKTQHFRNKFTLTPKVVVGIIGIILAIAILTTSMFVVDQTEQAVVLRFGRFQRTVGPGLQWKLPLGIEKNLNVPTQVVQTMTFGYQTSYPSSRSLTVSSRADEEARMLTGDLNIIDVEWIVQYQISDLAAWLFNVNEREKTIRDISQSVINLLVGDLPILSVMTSERTNIEIRAQQNMQAIFDSYHMGLKIVTVKLQNIVPPVGDVQDAFEDVNKAIQDMNRFINEGKEGYNRQIPGAQGEANKLIQEAEGYAAERVNQATGDVARFVAVHDAYKENKEITGLRLYIETMEDVMRTDKAAGTTTLIDKNLENFLPISTIGASAASQGGL